jgi:hypothetical protein
MPQPPSQDGKETCEPTAIQSRKRPIMLPMTINCGRTTSACPQSSDARRSTRGFLGSSVSSSILASVDVKQTPPADHGQYRADVRQFLCSTVNDVSNAPRRPRQSPPKSATTVRLPAALRAAQREQKRLMVPLFMKIIPPPRSCPRTRPEFSLTQWIFHKRFTLSGSRHRATRRNGAAPGGRTDDRG